MASLVIRRPELYPSGTTVNAYVLPTPRPGQLEEHNTGDPEAWKPALVKSATATATAESVTLTVPEATPLLLWGQVAGADRYLHARVSLPPVAVSPTPELL